MEIYEANSDRTEGRNRSTIKVDITFRQGIKEIWGNAGLEQDCKSSRPNRHIKHSSQLQNTESSQVYMEHCPGNTVC